MPVLVTALALLLGATGCGDAASARPTAPWRSAGASPTAAPRATVTPTPTLPVPNDPNSPTAPNPAVPSVDSLLRPTGTYFGVSTWKAPDPGETAAITARSGRHPTMLEFYLNWTEEFDPGTVLRSYQLGAVPLLTWEPEGASHASNQPDYALDRIGQGAFDPYLIRFAEGVRDQQWPVVIRLAHEMNGTWYPWSTGNSGNQDGDYVRAWRHVHDLFANLGVHNVIWLWSPNVMRPKGGSDFGPFYPGDAYVDWIGLDAYAFGETTAGQVVDPSIRRLRQFTGKPVLLAETASAPGPTAAAWTASLFPWLRSHPDCIGFVWFDHDRDDGGNFDYKFTDTPGRLAAFRTGIAQLSLRPWPVVPRDAVR